MYVLTMTNRERRGKWHITRASGVSRGISLCGRLAPHRFDLEEDPRPPAVIADEWGAAPWLCSWCYRRANRMIRVADLRA